MVLLVVLQGEAAGLHEGALFDCLLLGLLAGGHEAPFIELRGGPDVAVLNPEALLFFLFALVCHLVHSLSLHKVDCAVSGGVLFSD